MQLLILKTIGLFFLLLKAIYDLPAASIAAVQGRLSKEYNQTVGSVKRVRHTVYGFINPSDYS